uniref:NADH-ubiquinone oxidoreductase chain 5 n=1 Tax=Psychomyia kalais TaxID=2904897 RepID=A0A9E8LPA4_9NEOP|nr:NADH dehydrogenase subunit 5 [Psychomyia kalais]UZZ44345.1 NADH dehydrogenase subunit 5 [Psychomyia kalais]
MNLCYYLIFFMYLFFMCLYSGFMGLNFIMYDYYVVMEWELITLNSSSIVMLLIFDWISVFFMMFVLMISSMVMYYSKFYMSMELFQVRFIFLVLLFVISMLLMILSPNLISILLGWDGLGFISYCLVIFYQNIKSFNSGMLTVIMNRVGDTMILMCISWMFNYGSWNFMFYKHLVYSDIELSLVCLLVFLGAITKSAQIPFSSWLPAAMAAPTPVSALVHSSTLVTAGVYLLFRFMNLLEGMFIMKILFIISLLTMFMAGVSANYEFDLKKIIALSTLSQLGLMMVILSLNMKLLCFFHLLTHALFKSLLFLCAGLIIHFMFNNQDIRYMGNLVMFSPLLCLMFNVGNLALCGFPFMAGFYSKDLMAEMFLFYKFDFFFFFFFFISFGLTVSYTVRLYFYSILNMMNFYSLNLIMDDYFMIFSMIILMLFSVFGGSMISWLVFYYFNLIYLSFMFKFMVIIFIFMGLLLGNLIFKFKINYLNYFIMNLYMFMSNMFFMPFLFSYSISFFFFYLSKMLLYLLDMGWMEKLGSQGIYSEFMKMNNLNQFVQYLNLKIYLIIFMMLFLMIYLFN